MKIKAVRKNKWYKNQDYITLGKEYELIDHSEGYAEFCDDVGDLVCVILNNSAHGFDFEVVQENTPKFKVGDKVRLATLSKRFGPTGIYEDEVTEICDDVVYLKESFWHKDCELELVERKDLSDPMPVVEPEEDLMEPFKGDYSFLTEYDHSYFDGAVKEAMYSDLPPSSHEEVMERLRDSIEVTEGGPTAYYDFKPEWVTLNDMNDYKAQHQWGPLSFHMGNISKATYRFGEKGNTSKVYDINKIIYSGLRCKLMLEDKEAVRKYLQQLLDDPQFQEGTE